MTTKTTTVNVLPAEADGPPIVVGDNRPPLNVTPLGLALTLMTADPKGSIIAFSAVYDMDGKGKMLKTGNPYIGKGLKKIAKTQATVRFDYQAKREARGGEAPKGIRKPWHTVILIDGKPSALSVHRGDVLCNADGDAVYDANGGLTYTAAEPRFYLRYEVQRNHGDGDRQSRKMRSTSEYRLPNGDTVPTAKIKPFLPDKSRTDETDFQLTALGNLTALAINGQRYNIVGATVNV